MQARPFQLPLTSLLRKRMQHGDFVDSYAVPLADPNLTPVQLAQRLTVMPGWVTGLLWLRNGLVSPFGLKTAADLPPPSGADPAPGDYVSFFRLEELSSNEAIFGEDDAHLDFRVSVLKTAGPQPLAAISTWVHPHNLGGRLYLLGVLPFHKLIIRRMLANVAA
jgi:hypothetical protein